MKEKRDLDTILGSSKQTFDMMTLVRGANEELNATRGQLNTAHNLYQQAMQVLIATIKVHGDEIRIPAQTYYGIKTGTHIDVTEDPATRDILIKVVEPEEDQK